MLFLFLVVVNFSLPIHCSVIEGNLKSSQLPCQYTLKVYMNLNLWYIYSGEMKAGVHKEAGSADLCDSRWRGDTDRRQNMRKHNMF